MLAALALIPILIAVAIRIAGGSSPGRVPAFLDQIAGNGLFVGVTALVVATPLFLPLTIAVVAGDAIAGDASLGTLRYLLIAPAGRMRLLLVKYLVAAAFCVASTLTTVPVGAMAATAILAVAAQIAGAIPQLEWLHPWLFTDRWFDLADLLRSPPSWDSFVDNALVQAAYVAVFGGLAAWRFATRDILS